MKKLLLLAFIPAAVYAAALDDLTAAFCDYHSEASICAPVVVPDQDSDDDGVIDSIDQCPGSVGPVDAFGCPVVVPPEPNDPVIPVEDVAMIAAVLSAAPEQHPTEARFSKIAGSEINVLTQCGEFDYGSDILCYNSHNAFIDWTGGAWNFDDWEFALPAGGGHYDYGGNEVYVANMQASNGNLSVHWSRPIDPQPLMNGDCGAPVSGPVASHHYATPLWISKNREYWHQTTGGFPSVSKCTTELNATKVLGQGGWTHDKQTWTKRTDGNYSYGRACYFPNIDRIVLNQQKNAGEFILFDTANDYAETKITAGYWLSSANGFDSACDQENSILYDYNKGAGIKGKQWTADGQYANTFVSTDKEIYTPSLSIERSTGNLIIVGTAGYVVQVDIDTGDAHDISATDNSGIPAAGTAGDNIYGKFDMISKVPCVGIGMADARDGVYLMTLPASVCTQ